MSMAMDDCSQAMKLALQDALQNNKQSYEQMKANAHVYINKRECNVSCNRFCKLQSTRKNFFCVFIKRRSVRATIIYKKLETTLVFM